MARPSGFDWDLAARRMSCVRGELLSCRHGPGFWDLSTLWEWCIVVRRLEWTCGKGQRWVTKKMQRVIDCQVLSIGMISYLTARTNAHILAL